MIYYILRHEWLTWKNQNIIAKSHSEWSLELARAIWESKPLLEVYTVREYIINKLIPLPDFLGTSESYWLFSRRFLDLLKNFGVHFESLPIIIRDKKSKVELPSTHEFFHLQQVLPIVDRERSDMEGIEHITKLVLRELDPLSDYAMVRDSFVSSCVFVREDLVNEIKKAGITGCSWKKVEDYHFSIRHQNLINYSGPKMV